MASQGGNLETVIQIVHSGKNSSRHDFVHDSWPGISVHDTITPDD